MCRASLEWIFGLVHCRRSSGLREVLTLALSAVHFGKFAGTQFAALVEQQTGINAAERGEEAAMGAGNALHLLIAGQIA